jgi:thioredoxin-related protein
MIRKILILIVLISPIWSEKTETLFEKLSWKEALAKAKKEKKFIFLDAYADWCAPCIWMNQKVYTNEEVKKTLREKFISIQIDFDKEESELKKKLKIDSYPILLFFNSKGEILHRYKGPLDSKEFILEVKNSQSSSLAYYPLKRKYELGNITSKELEKFIFATYKAWGEVDNTILDTYFSKVVEFSSLESWNIIDNFLTDIVSKTFSKFQLRKSEFYKLVGKENVEKKYLLTYMEYYSKKENWEEYSKFAFQYADLYLESDWKSLDGIAWKLAEHIQDKKILSKAEKLAKKSIQIEPNFLNYETHALVLLKLEKYKEAFEQTNTSIRLARESGESIDSGVEILQQIIKKLLNK